MKSIINIAIAVCFFSYGSNNSIAQILPAINYQNVQKPLIISPTPIAQPSQSTFTKEELDQVFGTGIIKPGYYQIVPTHITGYYNTFCLIPTLQGLIGNFNYKYFQYSCPRLEPKINDDGFSTPTTGGIFIVPNRNLGYSIRSLTPIEGAVPMTQHGYCATVARNVVFGAASIDSIKCEFQNEDMLQVAADQTFTFELVGPDTYIIHTNNGECLDVRDSSKTHAEIIKWACTGNANQKFKLIYLGRARNELALEAALSGKGFQLGNGGMWRTVKTQNINFIGTPYSNTQTSRDSGKQCEHSCLMDKKCINWTYIASDIAIEPLCYLRDKFSSPIRAQGTLGGSIRH